MKRYTVNQYTGAEYDAHTETEEYTEEEDVINIVWEEKAVCMDIMANGKRLVPILRKIEESMTAAGLAGENGIYAGWFGQWADALRDPFDKKYFVWKYDGRQDAEQGHWSYSWEIEQIDDDRWYIFLNLARPEQPEQPADGTQEAQNQPEQTDDEQSTSDAQSAQNQPENGEGKKEEKKMLKSNSKQARENIRAYIVNHFDDTNYAPKFDYIEQAQQDNAAGRRNVDIFSMVAHAIAATFYAEKCQHDNRYEALRVSRYDLFADWCAGLPSILDTCYYYNRSAVDDLADILQESDAEKAKYTESQAEKRLTQLIYREIYNVVK